MNKDILNDCPELLREFLFYMETIRGRSPRTVDGYYIDLRTFFRYIKVIKMLNIFPDSNDVDFKQITINDIPKDVICGITLNDVYGFLHFALENLHNGAASRARKVSSLRAFYRYLTTKTNQLEENPVKDLEVPTLKKSMPKYLTLEESISLLDNIDLTSKESDVRNYCIITLFLNCGMRISELVGINIPDIRENMLTLLGKGNKERIIYLNDACKSSIKNYLDVRKPTTGEDRFALFLSRNGHRLTSRRVEQIVETCLKNAGLSGRGYSPHKLRHTAATLMYQHGGVDIRVLKEILGHASLGTTEIYTHVSDKQIESAASRSPLSKIKKTPLPSVSEQLKSTDKKEPKE